MNQHYTEVVGGQITYFIFVQALIETDLTLNNFSENTVIWLAKNCPKNQANHFSLISIKDIKMV